MLYIMLMMSGRPGLAGRKPGGFAVFFLLSLDQHRLQNHCSHGSGATACLLLPPPSLFFCHSGFINVQVFMETGNKRSLSAERKEGCD